MNRSKKPKRGTGIDGRITLDDVAQHSGVSRSTASLVLRESPLIPEVTKKRVQKVMSELGYVYNRSAANLRTQHTYIFGMIMADIANPFHALLAAGIERACSKENYLTIFADAGEDKNRQDLIMRRLIEQGVAGIFLCPASGATFQTLRTGMSSTVPVIQIMRHVEGVPCSYVGPDNLGGAAEATSYLIKLGHRDIAMLGGPLEWSSARERYEGYKSAHAQNGLIPKSDLFVEVPIDKQRAHDATLSLLKSEVRPTAIFCFNDTIAVGCMLALTRLGLVPGKDIAVVGFDDIPDAQLWVPSLTTVAAHAVSIGEQAAKLLVQEVQQGGTSRQHIIVKPTLMVRESSGGKVKY